MVPQAPRRPTWRLPPGVTRGTWDYVHSAQIAEDYDNYFSYSELFAYDQSILFRHLDCGSRPWIIDLGCGSGRAAVPLAQRGARVLAVDLSQTMLDITLAKAEAADLEIEAVRANLVELDGVATASLDHAICLFSTLGMVQGHPHRQQVLQHVHRLLRPGGKFILHVHNVVANLTDPGGVGWLIDSAYRRARSRGFEWGDKYFAYRGLPKMFLHTFSAGELKRPLRHARLDIVEWIPINAATNGPLPRPWWLPTLRASGWIVVAQKN